MFASRKTNFSKRAKIVSGVSAIALALSFLGASQAVAQTTSDSATPSASDFTKTQGDNSNWILTAKNYTNDRYVDHFGKLAVQLIVKLKVIRLGS